MEKEENEIADRLEAATTFWSGHWAGLKSGKVS